MTCFKLPRRLWPIFLSTFLGAAVTWVGLAQTPATPPDAAQPSGVDAIKKAADLIGAAATPTAVSDQTFKTPDTLSTEAIYLIKLLENYHYNRAAVHPKDYSEVIPDYMASLDGQHLFFLDSDKTNFTTKYNGETVYYKVAVTGDIDPAYEIYYTYRKRVVDRVNWIFDQLKKGVDLSTNETFAADRTKADWPATVADSDDVWSRHLKLEVLTEVLNKKSLADAEDIVRKRYDRMLKNMGEIDGGQLAELYLTSITALYDPHSNYFSSDTFEDFSIQMKLQLYGIGAMLRQEDDYCTVEELVTGGPADLGHQLFPQDKIISVAQDGKEPVEIIGMPIRKVVSMIRGPKGTRVHLIVQPANSADTSKRKEIVITRDVVKLNAQRAHGAIFQVPNDSGQTVPYGVITLPEFYGPADDPAASADKFSASSDTLELIKQMKAAGIQGLVLDLRHNGGGFLGEAINLASLFIPKGPVVQVKNSDGQIQVESPVNSPAGKGIAWDGPMAVLTDRFSASASEIVAGALQNYGRAIVIGDKSTHGKGTVQTVLPMNQISRELAASDAKTGAAKITIQKFYLPNGSSTQLDGVVPDISLPSVDDFLPIGESSLPHALIWDRIPTTTFDGKPLSAKVLDPLREMSAARQVKLDEFAYLRKDVDWFKARQDEKLISLNLEARQKEKTDDDAFIKSLKTERETLAKSDFPHKELWLAAPPVPKVKPAKKTDGSTDADDEDDDTVSTDDDDQQPYPSVDVHLKETFRILSDAIALGQNHDYWASNHPPLTVAINKS